MCFLNNVPVSAIDEIFTVALTLELLMFQSLYIDEIFTVALTLELYTPHEYVNYYDGRLGMLTISMNGVLHRIGRVKSSSRKEAATVVCRYLGFAAGEVLNGPWVSLDDGNYSSIEINCRGDENSVQECSTRLMDSLHSAMMVDYFICQEQNYEGIYSDVCCLYFPPVVQYYRLHLMGERSIHSVLCIT